MAGPFARAFFWVAVALVAVSHLFILGSTVRAMRAASADSAARGFWEWVWAFLPAVVTALLLWATWQAMHPTTFQITLPAERLIPGALR
jgi:heme/copper-type cytochrome/quinol oxidase subunit 2